MTSVRDNYLTFIAVYLFALLAGFFVVAGYTYFWSNFSHFIKSLIYVGVSGGLGAIVYCIRGYYEHITKKDFTITYTWWYISHPFTGLVLGLFAYFFIAGGLLALGSNSAEAPAGNILFYCAISFLAGFSLRQFLSKLEELARTLFAPAKKEEPPPSGTPAPEKPKEPKEPEEGEGKNKKEDEAEEPSTGML